MPVSVEAEAAVDKKDKKQQNKNGFDNSGPLHGWSSSSLFYPQDPEHQGDEDQEILGQFLEFLFFPDEVPDEERGEIGRDEIIEKHDDGHERPLSYMLQRTRNESLAL
jgi:hypothetical protein